MEYFDNYLLDILTTLKIVMEFEDKKRDSFTFAMKTTKNHESFYIQCVKRPGIQCAL